jgi:hypothetical protein
MQVWMVKVGSGPLPKVYFLLSLYRHVRSKMGVSVMARPTPEIKKILFFFRKLKI